MLQIGGIPWVLPGGKSAATFCKQPSLSPLYRSSSRSSSGHQQQKSNRVCCCFASAAGPTLSTKVAENMGRPFPPISTLKAVLFDVDGTLTDSDPLHYVAFRDMLHEEGYMGGKPITEEFFSEHISGKFNTDIGQFLFPDWEESRQTKWLDDKEALFRKMAADQLEGKPGLAQLCEWIKKKNLRRAAVTNAPRLNAEQMIASCGLTDFFEYLVIGSECERAKPFPDPYLKALKLLGIPATEAVVFEDSVSGTTAAVNAELPVVGVISGNPESILLGAGVAFAIKDFSDPALWSALGEPAPL
ncbi:unnamed protein product [Calypogeia fissa]